LADLGGGGDDDSVQFTATSENYENAGALVVSCWEEEEVGVTTM